MFPVCNADIKNILIFTLYLENRVEILYYINILLVLAYRMIRRT